MTVPEPEYLHAFSDEEFVLLQSLFAAQVISMSGRKLEEGDWTTAYCAAKGIPYAGWSNLDIDVVHNGLGVEHKMMSTGSARPSQAYGSRKMHPAMTRSIRFPQTDDPNEAMADVLSQYAEIVESRRRDIEQSSGVSADLRLGWLLWQDDLSEFLYFEEPMRVPNPDDFWADWNEIQRRGRRKGSRNLWIYEKHTGIKRYSVTTSAGVKIQPYFDVPPEGHPNAYLITVEGERMPSDMVRVWVRDETASELERLVGDLDPANVSRLVADAAAELEPLEPSVEPAPVAAREILISSEAYEVLSTEFAGASSDDRLRQVLRYFSARTSEPAT